MATGGIHAPIKDPYIFNGATVAAVKGVEPAPGAMLFRNNHDGIFTDVTEEAGVALRGWFTDATWGDYERDGWLDLFAHGYAHCHLDHPILAGKGGVPEGACQYRVNFFAAPWGWSAKAIISFATTATALSFCQLC